MDINFHEEDPLRRLSRLLIETKTTYARGISSVKSTATLENRDNRMAAARPAINQAFERVFSL